MEKRSKANKVFIRTGFHSNIYGRPIYTPPVGVNEAVSTTSFDVYPNPSDDFFHLTVDGVILNSAPEVVVYTLDGRVVYRDRLTEVTSLLPCADWPSGVYVVALSTTGMREVRRVVVR